MPIWKICSIWFIVHAFDMHKVLPALNKNYSVNVFSKCFLNTLSWYKCIAAYSTEIDMYMMCSDGAWHCGDLLTYIKHQDAPIVDVLTYVLAVFLT